jgi:uncharacterized membrane protein
MACDYAAWAARVRYGALLSTAVLLAIIAIDTLFAPSGGRAPNPVVWAALSLPLLIFVPGLWRGGLRSYAWLSFVSLLYFAQAVTALFVAQQRLLDRLDLLASVALFTCTLFFIRWRARAERAAAAQ